MSARTRWVLAGLGAWATALGVNRSLRRVTGRSMLPTLVPGDVVLVVPAPLRRIRRGDVVVIADPREPGRSTIKRVTGTDAATLWVEGDNPAASTDSRTYGALPVEAVRGWVPVRLGLPPRRLTSITSR